MITILNTFSVIRAVWLPALLGSGVVLIGVGAGWALAQNSALAPVRLVTYWVRRVVLPLVRRRSWLGRTLTIFVNNGFILSVLMLLSGWFTAALVGVAIVGISLGIGLRVLANESLGIGVPASDVPIRIRRSIRIGLWLNMLEPPAILLTFGLILGRTSIPLDATAMWRTFACWVVPALLVAAGGEALWIGAGLDLAARQSGSNGDREDREPNGS